MQLCRYWSQLLPTEKKNTDGLSLTRNAPLSLAFEHAEMCKTRHHPPFRKIGWAPTEGVVQNPFKGGLLSSYFMTTLWNNPFRDTITDHE